MNGLLGIFFLCIFSLWQIKTVIGTCDSDCTDCADAEECNDSLEACAFSMSTECISQDDTPFIWFNEKNGGFNWYEAEVRCQTKFNGHLASILSSQENELATSLCANHATGSLTSCWLGGYLYYNDGQAEYEWTDGSTFNFGSDGGSGYPKPPWRSDEPSPVGCDAAGEVCCIKIVAEDDCIDAAQDCPMPPGLWVNLPNGDSCRSQTEAFLCRVECKDTLPCEDDGNVCTEAMCVEGECIHNDVADGTECNSTCIANGKCFQGTCIGDITCGNAACDGLCCNDENPCMENTVCSGFDCIGVPVEDNSTCTIGCVTGSCWNGQCLNGVVDCSLGCNGTSCDDNDRCTQNDVCSNGVCVGIPIYKCSSSSSSSKSKKSKSKSSKKWSSSKKWGSNPRWISTTKWSSTSSKKKKSKKKSKKKGGWAGKVQKRAKFIEESPSSEDLNKEKISMLDVHYDKSDSEPIHKTIYLSISPVVELFVVITIIIISIFVIYRRKQKQHALDHLDVDI